MFDKMANEDFDRAVFKGFWRKVKNWFTGGSNELMAYDDVKQRIPVRGQHDRGLLQVRVDQIIGSVGRFMDFDRAFLPTQTHTRNRWVSIDKAHYEDILLPPVELYKIGELYFVKDGNHRISVARERGQQYVDAYVIEITVPGPVYKEEDLDTLVITGERETFLYKTRLDLLRPNPEFETRYSGQYDTLLEHIDAHRWYMGEHRAQEISYEEAVLSWHDHVYDPVIEVIEEQNLRKSFPKYSALDLYIWILEFQWYMREADVAQMSEAEKAIFDKLIAEKPDQPIRKLINILVRNEILSQISSRLDYGRFMEHTQLLNYRPGAPVETTVTGGYDQLLEHIYTHRWYLGESLKRDISFEEALLSWYDSVFMPLVEIIRDQQILENFPGRTEADLYLWVGQRKSYIGESEGIDIPLVEAAERLVETSKITDKDDPAMNDVNQIQSRLEIDNPDEDSVTGNSTEEK